MSHSLVQAPAVPRQRRVVLAGRIIAFLGVLHLVSTAVMSSGHVSGWFTGEMWFPANGPTDLAPGQGAFWLVVGSFGLPLTCLGLLVDWIGRRGSVPPSFVAWMIGGWGTLGAVILIPSPFILTWVPAVMLLLAARRAA
ncbi:DUF6463 family protein [Nonomuraea polychroma]|uniref:DUF6463 family protein n=1 Tax=Nonomuraea polychroma TaxID=46176 RepID=UPI003D8B177A